ncbi:uncharacterized protein LOC124299544 [Neodiprion virginianus]|uniref:uncharacterized protein LOC124299544 n=1 Tax=Neodiprion virginianus TaxID=2961670 RepID=UPI001EE6BA28|nr:uncharacterized protein LOC124299544 [Neodiprion virginianus]
MARRNPSKLWQLSNVLWISTHLLRDCRSSGTCGTCLGKHHTLLHGATISSSSSTSPVNPPSSSSTPSVSDSQGHQPPTGVSAKVVQSNPKIQCSTWLATARVNIILDDGRESKLRALIDPCSGASFIAESAVQRLNMPRRSAFVPVSGIGATRDQTARSKVSVSLTSQYDKSKKWITDALILPCLTDYLPSPRPFSVQLAFVSGLPLADPRPNAQDPIEMILGIDLYTKFIENGLCKSENEEVIAQQTALGWILSAHSGNLDSPTGNSISNFQCLVDTDLSARLQRFWEQEEISVNPDLLLTPDERECQKHYTTTFRRTNTGKYELCLPFKKPITELGDSYDAATAMLEHMERRFSRDNHFHSLYQDFMNEYLSLGHMRPELPGEASSGEIDFYLPHHGVLKAGRLRIVFNGSVNLSSGLPVNKCLYVGKNLLIDMVIVMLRWRMFPVVFSADIVKAFRQIGIAKEDQRFLKILWRRTPSSPVETFHLCTQLANDDAARFPAASRILKENIHVDDVLAGADTLEQTVSLKKELVDLLLAGKFPLRKWITNNQILLMNINPEDLAPALLLGWKYAPEL